MEREQLSNKTEIEKLLDELKDSIIGFENYKSYFEKIKNNDQVIISQIENLVREYKEYKHRYDEEVDKESHKNLMEDGFVKVEVLEHSKMMNKILLEAYNWKTLQEELYSIIFKKIYAVLDDARALDIKRDALKEMREMEERRQAMFIEIMGNMSDMFKESVITKLQTYDEKFLQLILMMDEDNRKDRKQIFDTLRSVVKEMNVIQIKKRDLIIKKIDTTPTNKTEKMYNLDKANAARRKIKLEQEQEQPQQQPRPQQPRPIIKENVKIDDIDAQFDDMALETKEEDEYEEI